MAKANQERYIFIVDDEPIQNEMLNDFLVEKYLYTVKIFDTGEEAIKHLYLTPEIVVLDYHLNGSNREALNGIDVLKQIKEKSPDTQVIMLSGQDKIEVAVDTMKYGAFDYVVKGESAFARVENIINRASEIHKLKVINKSQKIAITFLSVVIGLIFLWSFYFFLIKGTL